MIGVILGSSMLGHFAQGEMKKRRVSTSYGNVDILVGKMCILQRHGRDTPPHTINHHANILALKKMAVQKVVGISSVGSMKKGISPGEFVVISDFLQLSGVPTFYDKKIKFTVPHLSEELRTMLATVAKRQGFTVHPKGVYAQTQGPRLETAAEIRMLSAFADVVGMTIASEATLCAEQGIEYACICSVDNYANGVSRKMSMEMIRAQQGESSRRILKLIDALRSA